MGQGDRRRRGQARPRLTPGDDFEPSGRPIPSDGAAVAGALAARPPESEPVVLVFVGPFVLGLIIFIYIPIIWSIYLSFFESYNTVTPTKFVGVWQLPRHAEGRVLPLQPGTFIVFALFIVPTTFALSLLTAILVARTRVMQAFFRSVFFLPTACSYVVGRPHLEDVDLRRSALGRRQCDARPLRRGLDSVALLTKPPWYWLVIVSAPPVAAGRVLHDPVPRCAATDLADLGGEAAAIDGASGWQSFRYIKLPQLRPTSGAPRCCCWAGSTPSRRSISH